MSINAKYINAGQDVWYDPSFKAVLEDHMTYLRTHKDTRVQLLEPNSVIKYRFDLYSLFLVYGIEPKYHWTIMRVNKLNSPIDDISDLEYILVPSATEINRILSHYNSRNRKRGT